MAKCSGISCGELNGNSFLVSSIIGSDKLMDIFEKNVYNF